MRTTRLLGLAALVVVAVVGGLLLYLHSNLDRLVKDAIEHYGSEVLGTKVRVGSVSITLSEGRGTLRRLRVSNPAGFSGGDALRLEEVTLKVDPRSVTQRPVVVPEVRIVAPEVHYELAGPRRSNIGVLLEHVKSKEQVSTETPAAPVRLAIRSLTFEQARIEADLSAVGGERRTLNLPPVRLRDVGGSRGATPDEVARTVMKTFLGSVTRSAARAEAEGLIDEKLGGAAGEAAKKLLRGVLD